MSRKDIVYYGFPGESDYFELTNLLLVHDKIYDSEDKLSRSFSISPDLAEMLNDLDNLNNNYFQELFSNEDNVSTYSSIVLLISSLFHYYGLDFRDWWRIKRHGKMNWNQRLFSIDKLTSVNEKNSQKFIDIIIPSLKRAYKTNPNAFENTIEALYDMPLLNKFIIENKEFCMEKDKILRKSGDIIPNSMNSDLEDPKFYSYLENEKDPEANQIIDALAINAQIVQSSGLGMPLYMPQKYMDFIQYKYLKGARKDITQFKERECYEDAYKLFIPEIYTTDIRDLIELKNQKVFQEFRKETATIIYQWFEDSLSRSNFSDYLNEQYIAEIEEFTSNKTPSKKKVLLKGFFGYLDIFFGSIPIFNTLIGGKELFDAYHDNKKYRFALSVIGIKNRTRELKV